MAARKRDINKDALYDDTDFTVQFDPEDIEQNKKLTVFAYYSWLVLIPVFGTRSDFSDFHCRQGLKLAVLETLALIVMGALSFIDQVNWFFVGVLMAAGLGDYIVVASWVFRVLGLLLLVWCIRTSAQGVRNVRAGKAKRLPFVGKNKFYQE